MKRPFTTTPPGRCWNRSPPKWARARPAAQPQPDPGLGSRDARIHGLILAAHPDAKVVLSYRIPTYKVGSRRLHVGVWNHGVSIYGWPQERGADFTARHPALLTSKGTIRLRPQDAAGISDDELTGLLSAALEP